MNYDVGSEVRLVIIDSGWNDYDSGIDEFLGEWAEILETSELISGYLLKFENNFQYWVQEDWVTDDENVETEYLTPQAIPTPQPAQIFPEGTKFFISNKGNQVYRFLCYSSKWMVLENYNGDIVTSEYFTFRNAPRECKIFNWIPPIEEVQL